MKILFLSPKMAENMVLLAKQFGASTGTVKPNQNGSVTVNDLSAHLGRSPNAIVCIDAHFGPFDLQYMRELMSLEQKGTDFIRTHIVKESDNPKKLPESVKLMRLVRALSPNTVVMFITHRKIGANLKQALSDLGVSSTFANDDSVKEKTLAFSHVMTEATKFTRDVRKGAAQVLAAGKIFLQTIQPPRQQPRTAF